MAETPVHRLIIICQGEAASLGRQEVAAEVSRLLGDFERLDYIQDQARIEFEGGRIVAEWHETDWSAIPELS